MGIATYLDVPVLSLTLGIILVNYLFQATGHSFSHRNVIFGLREPCTIKIEGPLQLGVVLV